MASTIARAPWHLWLVGGFAVLFNAIGVFDYVMNQVQGEAYMASAGMTLDQIAHYRTMPAWMMVVWAVGVFGAFAASILLLFRRKAAFPTFMVSLAAFLVSVVYTYVLTDGGAAMGRSMAITSAIIALLLAVFGWYAWTMSARGVLR